MQPDPGWPSNPRNMLWAGNKTQRIWLRIKIQCSADLRNQETLHVVSGESSVQSSVHHLNILLQHFCSFVFPQIFSRHTEVFGGQLPKQPWKYKGLLFYACNNGFFQTFDLVFFVLFFLPASLPKPPFPRPASSSISSSSSMSRPSYSRREYTVL